MTNELFSLNLGDEDDITVFGICQRCLKNVGTVKPLPEYKRHYCIWVILLIVFVRIYIKGMSNNRFAKTLVKNKAN